MAAATVCLNIESMSIPSAAEPFLILLTGSAFALAILGALVLQHWSERANRVFFIVIVQVFIWTVSYLNELISSSLPGKLFWANIGFIAITFLPVSVLTLTLYFTQRTRHLFAWVFSLSIVPVVTNIVIWTDRFHHLFRIHPRMAFESGLLLLKNDYGVWFYSVHNVYSYGLLAVSLFLLGRSLIGAHSFYKLQTWSLILGISIPMLMDATYILGWSPVFDFNFTPVAFTFSAIVVGMGIRRYRLFNVLPLAKEVIFASIEAGVIIYDLSDRLVDFNPAAGEILNIQVNQIGQPLALTLAENPAVLEQLCCEKPGEQDSHRLAIEIKHAGRVHYYRVVKSPIQSLQTTRVIGYVASLYDVTEQERLYQEVRKLATFDPLTNVYNRRVFEELSEKEIAKIIRQHRSLTMIMLDVDQFKHINDTYGHQAGDESLQEVAQVCLSAIRQSDIFGRFGGDEFIFLLPNTPLSVARRVAERVRKSISQLQMVNPAGNYSVTASLGVGGAALDDDITFEKLFAAADQALYCAKQHGGNMVCYEMTRAEPGPAGPSEAQPAV